LKEYCETNSLTAKCPERRGGRVRFWGVPPITGEAPAMTVERARSVAAPSRVVPVWMRYAAGSLISTVISQIALVTAYGLLNASAAVASILAFVVGTVPNYLLNKAWAWSDQKVSHRRLVVSYVLVMIVTNALAIAMTLALDTCVRAHVRAAGPRTMLLSLAYVTSYGLMFVIKYLLFDGLLFKDRGTARHALVNHAYHG
jgi:putative flippase GtrA